MNILIPDIWLRTFLKTTATPEQIKEKLSLSGPSIERIYGTGKDAVYDIEITGNRPDAMSVAGVAREAATILPRFGIKATLIGDPYTLKAKLPKASTRLPLTLKTDPILNPRWMSVIFDNVTVKASPTWISNLLTLAGMRSLNNVVDITNFVMRAYGQPAHVFDYDQISGHYMNLRASKKGETLITLDGKKHELPGGDIVIEDKTGKLIDLCGIMGGENSSVTEKTKRVMLFIQTYNPTNIRKTSMALAHRTEAAGLFEKGLDTELVKPVLYEAARMMTEITGGTIASEITDIYSSPYKAKTVSVSLAKVRSYIDDIPAKAIKDTLGSLGFAPKLTAGKITVTVPSFRRDVALDVDVIEEIARIYGYHEIPSHLPDKAPPVRGEDALLSWEEDVKIRLRDWGYTELITYSMISAQLMEAFGADKTTTYTLLNPLSSEWEYMRPTLFMSMIPSLKENLKLTNTLKVFELGMAYQYRDGDIPNEVPTLDILWSGNRFREAKGLAEALFAHAGIPFPDESKDPQDLDLYTANRLSLGKYGSVGELKPSFLESLGIRAEVTRLTLDFSYVVRHATRARVYTPIPKHPPIVEDLSFIVPEGFRVGPLIAAFKNAHPLVSNVELLDIHENARTFHITYQDASKNLTGEAIIPARNKLIELASQKFGVTLKAV